MKKIVSILVLLHVCFAMQAQYKITFIVHEKTHIQYDSIFITGTFSGWDSTANPAYLLKPGDNGKKSITLKFQPGTISYKFHRGSWSKVEKNVTGGEVADRNLIIKNDSTIYVEIPAWRDDFFINKWQGLAMVKSDSERLKILNGLALVYTYPEYYNQDSALFYSGQSLQVLEKLKASGVYTNTSGDEYTMSLIEMQEITASTLFSLNNFHKSLQIRLENLRLGRNIKDKLFLVRLMNTIAWNYSVLKDYPNMLHYALQMDSLMALSNKNQNDYSFYLFATKKHLGWAYYEMGDYNQAMTYVKQAFVINPGVRGFREIEANSLLGNIYLARGLLDSATMAYRATADAATIFWAPETVDKYIAWAGLAKVFHKQGLIDSALFYAQKSYHFFTTHETDTKAWGANSLYFQAGLTPLLADLYQQKKQQDSAYKYLKLSITLKDSLYNTDKLREAQMLTFNEASRRQQEEQQVLEAKKALQTKLKFYILFGCIAAFLAIAFIQYRNNKQKQKANRLLHLQNEKVENTLNELRNTQKQLIQSEKMASLGELTAGIAHEIQNPLNFVNNFSEVNKELLVELKDEIKKGNLDEVLALADDVISNEEKINHHGKRADAIVKGMLQHSRTGSSTKEPTDINALCDEYLRLAYHGLRAKDKSFNATMKTDFDENIHHIRIIPQDIGRALLNLYTNAFYAVSEKKKSYELSGMSYEPLVSIITKRINDKIEIKVSDNGNGIPQNIVDKIFQPFFTTKPTGQGTGLGLSLSYDIVKAHGGELAVASTQNQETIFTITLPINNQ